MDSRRALQHNQLLASLPKDVLNRLVPNLELVLLPLGQILHEPERIMQYAYFPTNAVVSLFNMLENGESSEAALVGNEGFVGMPLLMGGESTSTVAMVTNIGYAYRLPRHQFKDELNRHNGLLLQLLRYTQTLITQMTQTAACNRHHSIDQQLCRWLLLSIDRTSKNQLTMTQESIANMLGVRREGVTLSAHKLQKLGVIEYTRGKITVLDRSRLEKLSCECYSVVKKETDRLLPSAPKLPGYPVPRIPIIPRERMPYRETSMRV
jgi:CRP-like cAMP-binding protein